MNKTLSEIQAELKVWTIYNFGKQESIIPIMGMIEELGELTHAHLKELQGIRKSDFLADKKDAIADIIIYLLNYFNCGNKIIIDIFYSERYCYESTNSIILKLSERISTLGREYDLGLKINIIISEDIIQLLFDYSNKHNFDLLTIINETWEQVKLRDWKKYPKDGRTE